MVNKIGTPTPVISNFSLLSIIHAIRCVCLSSGKVVITFKYHNTNLYHFITSPTWLRIIKWFDQNCRWLIITICLLKLYQFLDLDFQKKSHHYYSFQNYLLLYFLRWLFHKSWHLICTCHHSQVWLYHEKLQDYFKNWIFNIYSMIWFNFIIIVFTHVLEHHDQSLFCSNN